MWHNSYSHCEMKSTIRFQIPDDAVCISLQTSSPEKDLKLSLLPLVADKFIVNTRLFIFGKANRLENRKLRN